MRDYLSQIKEVCNTLITCGSPISDTEHIATILNGLPKYYDSFVAVITSNHEPYTLDRLTTILMNAESCLHDPLCLPLFINIAQVMTPTPIDFVFTPRPSPNTFSPSAYSFRFPSQAQFSRHVHTSHFVPKPHSSYNNRGRGKTTSRLQCQLCGRMGHLVDQCF
ncbi:hypothetical protein J1N35_001773 [Gossypium stocksii]|uniref:CCHC-type domain-containing protein n=1 Tax=Gossypium stocksii TaxID=47602 RepID=A0A9D4AJX7_9ROSI|nr:hypothetical protein J1N35_001773 [Gossypium stocksii]